MKTVVLASKSPRRKELLESIGISFIVDPSDIEEIIDPQLPLEQVPNHLSKLKANDVASRYKNAIIIGADTVVIIDNQILGKPSSKEHAKKMLISLSGKTHKVITGFTILDTKTKKQVSSSVTTLVSVKTLTEQEIDEYIKTGEPFDAAGGYRVQGKYGKELIEEVDGDLSNVIGFPIQDLKTELRRFELQINS